MGMSDRFGWGFRVTDRRAGNYVQVEVIRSSDFSGTDLKPVGELPIMFDALPGVSQSDINKLKAECLQEQLDSIQTKMGMTLECFKAQIERSIERLTKDV